MQQFLLLLFILSTCTAAKPLCPVGLNLVQFSSQNRINNLTWEPTKNVDRFFYTVKYKASETPTWQTKSECTKITRTWCDLTKETHDVKVPYVAKVFVHKRDCSTTSEPVQFGPQQHTKTAKLSEKQSCLNRVQFSSRNLINNLTWEPPKNSDGSHYSVTYKLYGTPTWLEKAECTKITQTWCDLTNETGNVNEDYCAKVFLHERNCSTRSKPFKPWDWEHSKFDPPIVSLFPRDTSIEINLSHTVKDIQKLFKGLKYDIYWHNNGSVEIESPYYKLEDLDHETTYCVEASIKWFRFDTGRSGKVCTTTSSDHSSEQAVKVMLYILPVAFITLIVVVIICAIYHYIHVTNLKQPTFLNITTTDNRNALLIDAQNVTINVITVDSGTLNIPQTVINDREEMKEESKSPVIVHLPDSEYHASSASSITEYEDEDHGYVSLQEQKLTARPTISPYDMPQTLNEPVRPLSSPSDIVHEEGDLYGRIKCNSTDESVQEKEYLRTVQTEYAPKESLVNDLYLPQGDSKVPFIDKFKENLCELEESFTGQDADNIKMIEDLDVNETSALFLDWSPDNPDVYIPNVLKKRELESCIQQCHTEQEALLSELHSSLEIKGNSEEEDLEELEDRWGLHVQGL